MYLEAKTNAAVVGAGTMGIGIAQVLATAGHSVHVVEPNSEVLDNNRTRLLRILNRLVEKGRLEGEQKAQIVGRMSFSESVDTIPASAGLVVEAIIEDLGAKKDLFAQLESIVARDAVLATNTSSLSVTSIAAACEEPSRVVGLHFFNPAPLLDLVEVVPGLHTSPEVVRKCYEHLSAIGKKPVIAGDTPGFIVNRIARPFYGEALRILEEGIASVNSIDSAMKSLGGFRMGPFELMDLIGNDVNYAVTRTVYEAFFYDPRYRPSFTQKRMVDGGLLGKKSGAGYYRYDGSVGNSENQSALDSDVATQRKVFDRILTMLINEAVDALFWNVATPKDIETAMTAGVNYPSGLLAWGAKIGFGEVLAGMRSLQDEYGEDRYRPSPLLRRLASGKVNIEL